MLPCDNIRHTLKQFGIVLKEISIKYFADAEQLLGVNGGLIVKPLEGAAVDVQLVGEPLVGVALVAQFVTDKVAYVYLHSGCCLCVWLPIPYIHSSDCRQKRRRAISSPVCGRGKLPSGIDKMLACRRAFAHLSFLNDLFEVFHVSYWSGQIANAMLLIVYLLQ